MKGLLIKEWVIMKSHIIIVAFFAIFFIVLGLGEGSFFATVALPVLLGLLPSSYINYDETSKWQRFSLAMPYSRKKIVSAKYVMTIIMVTIGVIISAIVMSVNFTIHDSFVAKELLYAQLFVLVSALICPMLVLPLNFKFGATLGRFIMMAIGGVIGVSSTLLDEKAIGHIVDFFSKMNTLMTMLVIIGGFIVLFSLSWFISIKIYEHKDL